MAKVTKNTASDLYGEVQQSACDKLLGSAQFPLIVLEQRQDFPGCARQAAYDEGPVYEYTKLEIESMLKDAVAQIHGRAADRASPVTAELYSFAGSILEQAKKVLDASASSGYEGPDKKEMQAILDGGTEKLVETLRGDFGLYAWCQHLRVTVRKRPKVILSSPRIDLNGISIEISATGELWSKYPWWNCYKWCTKWEKVHKCTRIASISASITINAEAHADIAAIGPRVYVRGEFDRLRLDIPIIDKIELKGIANRALGNKPVCVYDASQLVETVPVLGSKFSVGSVVLPTNPTGIGVGVVLRQIK